MDNLFIGVMPAGISYCDRSQEVNHDYKRIAFLDYQSLTLTWHAHCTPAVQEAIATSVAAMRARRGQRYNISTCGQTVLLGSPCLHNSMIATQDPAHAWACVDCDYVY